MIKNSPTLLFNAPLDIRFKQSFYIKTRYYPMISIRFSLFQRTYMPYFNTVHPTVLLDHD
jgi:hypothetical protein